MFTGIVAAVGEIIQCVPQQEKNESAGVQLTIKAPGFLRPSNQLGDSIAIQGACMTVVAFDDATFRVDVSRESLNRTTGLDTLGPVNLEHALCMGDSLDGHMVSGHVDGLGKVSYFQALGESWDLRIVVPKDLAKYMAYKGSVTVNGVSLTVNHVKDTAEGCEIRINLIPHTVAVTTLKHLQSGQAVNLEVDMIARYVERMLTVPGN